MSLICFLAVASFLIAAVLTPLFRDLFRHWGFVDKPDESRKLHSVPVPRVGGIPIAISYVAAFGLLLAFARPVDIMVARNLDLAWRLLPAAAAAFLTGLIDDLVGLKPWQKLAGQFIAAGCAWWAGVRILAVADHSAHWWSLPLTLVWLVGCTNAFNLIDGIDGLAAGIGLVATLTIVAEALIHGNLPLAAATVPLAGALLGFLRYNFNPASIFMGDCGSLLVGFLLGSFGVIWSQKSATMLGMTAPLLCMVVPVMEVALSILRRFLRSQPIFGGDRGHVHHRLIAMGLRPRHVVLVLYGVCGLGAACSLLQSTTDIRYAGAAVVLFCVVVWLGVRRLGYIEFGVAHRMLVSGEFRRVLRANIRLQMFHEAVAHSRLMEDCWPVIREACRDFGFTSIKFQVGENVFEETFDPRASHRRAEDDWSVRIDLADGDYAVIRHPLNAPLQSMIILPFLEEMHSQLLLKCRGGSRMFGQASGATAS
jgi:UDP-GlcNAc:undecaprenyl-phosphate/decaprenyl-phosphate GlcNAc-1-phosphate transferase